MIDLVHIIGETTDYDKKQQLEVNKPKSWCKSVSAFANGRGGSLIFGVADDDTVIGLEDPQYVSEKFSEIVKSKLDPVPEFSLSFEKVDGKTLMIVRIEPGTITPYYYMGDGQQIAFCRIGNESVPATANMLRELVLRGSHQSYDSLLSGYKFENYAFTKLRSVFHARTGKEFTDDDYESWGIVNADGRLTNAGALLADESPVRHSRIFCTRWNGLDQAHGIMDALDDTEVSGSLVILLQEGLDFCRRNSKKMWYKTPDGRVELPGYPEESILEGLVNALIHRSYIEIGGEVHIDIFDDRIEIENAGKFPTSISPNILENNEEHNKANTSLPPNPIIANVMFLGGLIENSGRGLSLMFDECGRAGLEAPTILDNGNFVKVIFKRADDASRTQEGVKQESSKSEVEVKPENVSAAMLKLIDIIGEQWLSAAELLERLGFKSRNTFRKNDLLPALSCNLIQMQNPTSPNAPNQRYGLTIIGKKLFYREFKT